MSKLVAALTSSVALDAATLAALENIVVSGTVALDSATLAALETINALISGQPITIDANNTTTTPLAAGATFTGTATNVLAYQQINVTLFARPSVIQGDANTAVGSLFLEIGPDGTNWDVSIPYLVRDPGLVIPTPLINVGKFFRLRYLNDGGVAAIAALGLSDTAGTPRLQTSLRMTTYLLPLATKELTRTLDQGIQGSDPAGLTIASLLGKRPSGTYGKVSVDQFDHLNTALANVDIDIFRQLVSSGRTNQVEVHFDNDTPGNLTTVTTVGTGSAVQGSGNALFSTGTGTTSSSKAVSIRPVTYNAMHEIYCGFTAAFTTPTSAASSQQIGLYDAGDGFRIGYSGTTFGVWLRTGGVDTFIARSAWNGDKCLGAAGSQFTRLGVPEALNTAFENVYRIRFGWFGSAPALFETMAPDGQWVVMHTILQPNSSANPSIQNPDLPMTLEVIKTASDATNLVMRSNCWAAGTTASVVTLSRGRTGQQDATTATVALPPQLPGRKSMRLKNMLGSARALYYGFTAADDTTTMDELSPGEPVEFDVDPGVLVYIRCVSTAGSGVRCSFAEFS